MNFKFHNQNENIDCLFNFVIILHESGKHWNWIENAVQTRWNFSYEIKFFYQIFLYSSFKPSCDLEDETNWKQLSSKNESKTFKGTVRPNFIWPLVEAVIRFCGHQIPFFCFWSPIFQVNKNFKTRQNKRPRMVNSRDSKKKILDTIILDHF